LGGRNIRELSQASRLFPGGWQEEIVMDVKGGANKRGPGGGKIVPVQGQMAIGENGTRGKSTGINLKGGSVLFGGGGIIPLKGKGGILQKKRAVGWVQNSGWIDVSDPPLS